MTNAEIITIVGLSLQTLIYLLAGYGLVVRNDQSGKDLKQEVEAIQEEIKGMAKVVTQVAVQKNELDNVNQRLNTLDKRIEDLRRGHGFIAGAKGIEREF